MICFPNIFPFRLQLRAEKNLVFPFPLETVFHSIFSESVFLIACEGWMRNSFQKYLITSFRLSKHDSVDALLWELKFF